MTSQQERLPRDSLLRGTSSEERGCDLCAGRAGPIRAAIALDGRHPDKAKLLQAASAYELGEPSPGALSGDKESARAAYQDFLALWKDGDPDIPILKQAKAEYVKLQ